MELVKGRFAFMEEMQQIIANIGPWLDYSDILARVQQTYYLGLAAYRREEPEEFTALFPGTDPQRLSEQFPIQLRSISTKLCWPDGDFPLVSIALAILYNGQEFGYFWEEFYPDGRSHDDFWHFYPEPQVAPQLRPLPQARSSRESLQPTIDLSELKVWGNRYEVGPRSQQRFWTLFSASQEAFLAGLRAFYVDFDAAFDNFDAALLRATPVTLSFRIEDWPRCEQLSVNVYIKLDYRKQYYKKKGVTVPFKDGYTSSVHVGHWIVRFSFEGEILDERLVF